MPPKDDVADIRNVYDVMTPDEIRGSETKRLLEYIMQTPERDGGRMGIDVWMSNLCLSSHQRMFNHPQSQPAPLLLVSSHKSW